MKEQTYNNPRISELAHHIKKQCSKRFGGLDAFNADCKAITRLLAGLRIDDVEWVGELSPSAPLSEWNGDVKFQVGWHDQTIVYRSDSCRPNLNQALPLYEAPAEVRFAISKDGLIEKLLEKVLVEQE